VSIQEFDAWLAVTVLLASSAFLIWCVISRPPAWTKDDPNEQIVHRLLGGMSAALTVVALSLTIGLMCWAIGTLSRILHG
jgi:hypothetical protein